MIRPTVPEDFDAISLHPLYKEFDPGAIDRCRHMVGKSTYTILTPDGDVLCIFGINAIWDGVLSGWTLTSGLVEKYPKLYFVPLKKILDQGFPGFHRFQTTVWARHKAAIRVNVALGLKKEGVLKKYGPTGEDFYIFGRTY